MSDETLRLFWDLLDGDQVEAIFQMLSNEQLMTLREKGAMNDYTMQIFKTEMFKRCLIEFDEVTAAFMN